jgi:hypothetical protein
MILDVTHPAIHYDSSDRTFSAELSSLGNKEIDRLCFEGKNIWVYNPKTNKQIMMHRTKTDTDSSGEDVYGWWYRGYNYDKGVSFFFLFIND